METAFEHALSKDVPVNGLHHISASRVRAQIQLGVQREQLERVVMIWSRCGSARTHVADSATKILRIDSPIRQLRLARDSALKLGCVSGNVENQPVSDIIELLLQSDVGIVQQQRE